VSLSGGPDWDYSPGRIEAFVRPLRRSEDGTGRLNAGLIPRKMTNPNLTTRELGPPLAGEK
jgi:hypothetical protein